MNGYLNVFCHWWHNLKKKTTNQVFVNHIHVHHFQRHHLFKKNHYFSEVCRIMMSWIVMFNNPSLNTYICVCGDCRSVCFSMDVFLNRWPVMFAKSYFHHMNVSPFHVLHIYNCHNLPLHLSARNWSEMCEAFVWSNRNLFCIIGVLLLSSLHVVIM